MTGVQTCALPIYVAVPVLSGDDTLGAVRLSHPKSHVDNQVRNRVYGILGAGLISLVAALVVAVLLGTTISRPIERLRRATDKLGRGDFDARAGDGDGPREIRELARSFNAMSGRLGLMVENQRHFAGSVSHQLRTPLTALRLRLENAAEQSDPHVMQQSLDEAIVEVQRLQVLIAIGTEEELAELALAAR